MCARRAAGLIYASYKDAQGLWYGLSMAANIPCVALFERAAAAMPTAPAFHHALADATLEAARSNWIIEPLLEATAVQALVGMLMAMAASAILNDNESTPPIASEIAVVSPR